VNWIGADLRGRNLKNLFPPKPLRPWSTDISAARPQPGRYIKKADRPTSRDWSYRVHLDLAEFDAAIQYHHDWTLAGLRPNSSAEWLEPSNKEDFTYGGQVASRDHYGEFNRDNANLDDVEPVRTCEDRVSLSEAELLDLATPKIGEEVVVKRLVAEYIAAGGTVKVCPPGMTTRRDSARRVVEWIVPSGTPIRTAAVRTSSTRCR
jgi:hypothetical protein